MKRLFIFFSLLFSIAASAQTIKQKQVEGLSDSLHAIKTDTAWWFGIDSSLTFSNVTELRATTLYSKGGRLATTFGYNTRNDGGGSDYIWNANSTATDDGILIFKPDAISGGSPGRWEWRAKGVVRAAEVGVKSDGTDQTSKLNSLFSLSTVKEVVFDNGDVTISNNVNALSKKIRLENDAKIIIGANDTLKNALVDCDYFTQCFDVSASNSAVINLTNTIVSVRWFGAKPDFIIGTAYSQTKTDNLIPFTKALNSISDKDANAQYQLRGGIYLPSSPQWLAYYLSDTWDVNAGVDIFGDGIDKTILIAPTNKATIKLSGVYGSSIGGSSSTVRDLFLRGNTSNNAATQAADTISGIVIRQNFTQISRVRADYFSGNGFYIDGTAASSGNSNNGLMSNCWAQANARNGFKWSGDDANNWTVMTNNAQQNGICGFWDNDPAGNNFYGNHAAGNGTENIFQRSWITIGGREYLCFVDNTAVIPGVTAGWANYWYDWRSFQGNAPVYDTGSYVAATGYYFSNINQAGYAGGNYDEGDEISAINLGNTLIEGGSLAQRVTLDNRPYASGSITVQNGTITQKNLQIHASDYDILLRPDLGVGINATGGQAWQYKYYDGGGGGWQGLLFQYQNNPAYTPLWFTSTSTAGSVFGRTGSMSGSYSVIPKLFLEKSYHSARELGMLDAAPSSGANLGNGSFYINTGSDTSILGWRIRPDGSGVQTIYTSGGTGGSSTLASLTDVSLTSLATNDFLKYNGTSWINRTPANVLSDIGAQASLVSATNIKTINGSSILGSGNLSITASAAGSNTQVQYNSSGSLAGSSNLTFDGTTLNANAATIGNTSLTTTPLTIDASSGTPPTYLMALGKGGNSAYFRINNAGEITDINGLNKKISATSGGGISFPDGFSGTYLSTANSNVDIKGSSGFNNPWLVDAAANTSDNVTAFSIRGSNATTPGPLLGFYNHSTSLLGYFDAMGKGFLPAMRLTGLAGNGTGVVGIDNNGDLSFSAGSGGTPGGSTTQVQYNNSSAFAGAANLTIVGGVPTLTNQNLGLQVVTTSGGTTTLTVSSPYETVFTGSSNHAVALPDATTLVAGHRFRFTNTSSANITVRNNGASNIVIFGNGYTYDVWLSDNSTSNGVWQFSGYNRDGGPDLSNVVKNNQANSYTAGMKQTVTADATNAGFKFGGVTANPSSLAAGDMWFRSDVGKLTYYDGATPQSVATEAATQTLTNKTINWTNNTNSLTVAQLNAALSSGGPVATTTGTETLTNKRITKRTGTVASSATPTINTDNVDYYSITALAANITSFTTNLSGAPTAGQTLWISITDNGTARTLAFGTSFEASTVPLPTTTVISTRLDCLFVWNEATSKWRIVACQ